MSLQNEVDQLRRIPLFSQIDTAKLKLMAFTSERLSFAAGQALFREGDPGDAAFLILGGSVEVQLKSAGGPITVARLEQNSFVGEMSILCDAPRSASVVAADPVEALKIKKETFFQLLKDVPQMALEVMRELAHRLHNTNEELRDARAQLQAGKEAK
jgi:CRP/FNR family transcriptional regulator, cyclic AMP receptor protein